MVGSRAFRRRDAMPANQSLHEVFVHELRAEGGINSAAQSVAPEMPVAGSRSGPGARRPGNGRSGTNAR
jgi:hypothetical protein